MVIIIEWDSLDKAQKFAQSKDLKKDGRRKPI